MIVDPADRRGLRGPPIVVVLALLVGACSSDRPGDEVAASEGAALYEAHCAMCHGAGLEGGGPMAAGLPVEPPSLFEHLGHHTEEQLIGLIRSGVPPAMPPAPISDDEVRRIIDYAWTQLPDSLAATLREMQRQMEAESGGAEMDHSAMGHEVSGDTTGR